MVLAAPSVMASGQEYRPEAGLYRYSFTAWYSRLYSPLTTIRIVKAQLPVYE
jgi:hypothetical protein